MAADDYSLVGMELIEIPQHEITHRPVSLIKTLVGLADTFCERDLMGVCISHPVCGAGSSTHCNQDYFIVVGDKRLGICTKMLIIEKVQPRWMLLLFPKLRSVLWVQRGIEGQNLEALRVRDLFVNGVETLHLFRIKPPSLLITRKTFSE